MARGIVHGEVRDPQGPAQLGNLGIMRSPGRRLFAAEGPVSSHNTFEIDRGLKVGIMIAAIFILMITFLTLCEKREKLKAYFTHEKAQVGPVPDGVELEDLQETRTVPRASAAQIGDQDEED